MSFKVKIFLSMGNRFSQTLSLKHFVFKDRGKLSAPEIFSMQTTFVSISIWFRFVYGAFLHQLCLDDQDRRHVVLNLRVGFISEILPRFKSTSLGKSVLCWKNSLGIPSTWYKAPILAFPWLHHCNEKIVTECTFDVFMCIASRPSDPAAWVSCQHYLLVMHMA